MTNRKTTRRALVLSILSLLVCCSMLVGTTFAWFTDSVQTGNNKIVAGNLDVELYYQLEGQTDWTKVDSNTNVFKEDTLWEPGHTEVVKLKVVNEGTLALKYQLGVNIAGETGSINAAGKEFLLSDHIKFAVIEGEKNYTREQAVAAAEDGNATALNDPYSSGVLTLAADEEKIVTMVVYMPTTVGNEANHKTGAATPKILLGLNLYATQVEAEIDSFGPDYDKDAVYANYYVHTQEELDAAIAALKAGETVALYAGSYTLPMNDTRWKATDLPAGVTIWGAEAGVKVTPVSNGSTGVGEQGRIQAENYTFKNITFTNTVSPSGYGQFVDCVFEGYNGLRHGAYKGTTRFVGCEFKNADGWAFHTEYLYGADVYFEGCTFRGLVEFTDTIEEANTVYFDNCAFLGTNRTSSGKIFYAWKNNAVVTNCAGYDASLFAGCTAEGNDKIGVSTSEEFVTAINEAADGSTIMVAAGEYALRFTNNTAFNVDNLTIQGMGEVKLAVTSSEVWYGRVQGSNVTFENIHFTTNVGATGKATYNDCTFDDWTICASSNNEETHFNNCEIKGCLNTSTDFSSGDIYVKDSTVAKAEYSGAATMNFDGCTVGELVNWNMATNLNNTKVETLDLSHVTSASVKVDGVSVVQTNDALKAAVNGGAAEVKLLDGEYDLNGIQKAGLTLTGIGTDVKVANTTKYAGGKAEGAIWQPINLENVTITNTVYTMADGGASTFKNVYFAAGFRQGYGKSVTFEGCTFGSNSEGYALHFQTDSASEGGKITLKECKFEGGKVHLGGKRAYEFTGCEFAAGTDFQVWSTVTLNGCTVNGEAVAAANAATLFPKLDLTKVTIQ